MNYTFNEGYQAIAAKFPITNVATKPGLPIVVAAKSLGQRTTRETYAAVTKAKASGVGFTRATVYGPDGVSHMTAEHHRKTDIFPATLAHNSVHTSTQLNDLVRDIARDFWGIPTLEPIGPWWAAGYGVGDKFEAHCDGAIQLPNGEYKRIEHRLISAICYINEKDSDLTGWGYTGGELIFPGILDEAGLPLTVHPKEGDLVVFPSNWIYCHAVAPITSGYRVTLTNFFG